MRVLTEISQKSSNIWKCYKRFCELFQMSKGFLVAIILQQTLHCTIILLDHTYAKFSCCVEMPSNFTQSVTSCIVGWDFDIFSLTIESNSLVNRRTISFFSNIKTKAVRWSNSKYNFQIYQFSKIIQNIVHAALSKHFQNFKNKRTLFKLGKDIVILKWTLKNIIVDFRRAV